jgi:Zn-dependent membrane protease YugP
VHRLILLFSLLILLAAIVLRKVNADRALRKARAKKMGLPAGDLARKMLDSLQHDKVKIEVTTRATRVWAGADVIGKKWLRIPTQVAGNLSAHAHGQAALRVGLYLLSLHDPKAMGRRRWALRFGQVFPIFTAMVVVFGIFVRLPMGWALAIMMTSLALAACAQILTVYVERQASELACLVLERKRILPRLSDEEAVIAATRAWSWYGILPGILSRLT